MVAQRYNGAAMSSLVEDLVAWDDWCWENGMLAVSATGQRARVVQVVGWEGPAAFDVETLAQVTICDDDGGPWLPDLDDPATEGLIDAMLRVVAGKRRAAQADRDEQVVVQSVCAVPAICGSWDLLDASWSCNYGSGVGARDCRSRIEAKVRALLEAAG